MREKLEKYLEKAGEFLNSKNGLILLAALHGTGLILNIRGMIVKRRLLSAVSAGVEVYMFIKTLHQLSGKGEVAWGRSLRQ